MPRVSFNRLSKKRSSTRKRRASVYTKTRYARPSAHRNKKLALTNALAIRAIKRMQPPKAYCDWQQASTLFADVAASPNYTTTIASAQLMSPLNWTAVLRQDANVLEASSTLVKRLVCNLRYTLQDSNWAQISLFVVTFRKDAANRTINSLTSPEDFIRSTQDFVVRLNPSVCKVHYVRHVSLTKGAFAEAPAVAGGVAFAGNPATTMAKGQVNMTLNAKIRQPLGTTWTAMDQDQFVPGMRYQLLCFITQQSDSSTVNTGVRIDYDCLATTMNLG